MFSVKYVEIWTGSQVKPDFQSRNEQIMKKGQYLDVLLRSPRTVFSTKDIALMWGEKNQSTARERLRYYVKKGELIRVRRGLYAKDKNYNKFELATKIYTPSYISFETVLARSGIIFQFYSQIFIASYVSRNVKVGNQTYTFRRIRDSILTNHTGIEVKDNYHMASPERAFLDTVLVKRNYYFDNLSPLDWQKVFEIMRDYKNKSLEKAVMIYKKSGSESR